MTRDSYGAQLCRLSPHPCLSHLALSCQHFLSTTRLPRRRLRMESPSPPSVTGWRKSRPAPDPSLSPHPLSRSTPRPNLGRACRWRIQSPALTAGRWRQRRPGTLLPTIPAPNPEQSLSSTLISRPIKRRGIGQARLPGLLPFPTLPATSSFSSTTG